MAVDVKSLAGNEIYDGYKRTVGVEGRWGTTWNVFKKSFGKLVLINLLMLVFFAPAITVLILKNVAINTSGLFYPFNSNTGIGYPANINAEGLEQSIYYLYNMVFTALLIACGFIAAIGISGGAYSVKKLLDTEGKFTVKDFFHGVKIGYFKALLPVILFLVAYFCCVITGDWKDLVIAQGGSKGGPITAYVFVIIAAILIGFYCAWLLATGISYRLKFSQLLKVSLLFFFYSPLQTILIAGLALVPFWLYLIGTKVTFFIFVAYVVFLLMGFSVILLVWTSFTQWVFDKFIEPKIKVEESKSKKMVKTEEPKSEKDIARELLAAGRSEILGKPILPVSDKIAIKPLGKTFNRSDLNRINSDREKLHGEILSYENAHKNEKVYAEYNKLFAEREKALQPEIDKKGKKKKTVNANNLLGR